MESVDWKTELTPNRRQKIVNKIIDTLKNCNSFLGQDKPHELKNIAIMFEEKTFTLAESKFDYMRRISSKMQEISQQSKATGNPANPSDPGVGSQGMQQANNQGQPPHVTAPFNHPQAGKQILPQSMDMNVASSSALQPSRGMSQSTVPNLSSQNSSLQNIRNMSAMPNIATQNSSLQNIQNMSGVQHISAGNSMGQRQIPGSQQQSQNSQYYRYQQQLHQVANQQFQQNNNTTSVQSHIQQEKLMQPTYFHPSQQSNMRPTMLQPSSVSNAQQNQQPIFLQSGQPVIQHHQQSVIKQEIPQQPIFLESGQPVIQHHQQSVIKQEIQQQPIFLESGQPLIQHHQQSVIKQERQQQQQLPLTGQQNNLSNIQQNSIGQRNNFTVIHQQHLEPQSSQKRQQHQLLGTQSGNSAMLNNQHSARLVQSTQGQRSQVELPQQAMPQIPMQSGQLYHQSNIKQEANMSQGDMQQRLPTSQVIQQQIFLNQQKQLFQQQTAMLETSSISVDPVSPTGDLNHGDWQQRLPTSQAFQQQILLNQQKQLFQQQRAMPETSSIAVDPVSPTGDLNSGDWQEEAYQKIQAMKHKYMRYIVEMHRKFSGMLHNTSLVQHDSDPRQPKSKQFADLTKIKQTLEVYMGFLQVPKTNIPPNYKELLGLIEKNMVKMISKQQQLTAPHINSLNQSQQTRDHLTQVQPHENQMSSQMQSVNLQHSNMSGLQHNNMGLRQPTSNMLQPHQLKQLQDREMQRQQLLQEQIILNQQHQLHPRTKQQQPNRNRINNGKELEVRQQTGVKSEPLKQQKLSVYQQQLKSGTPFSSTQIDKRNLLNSATKSGTPLHPIMVSSPSPPYTSHMPKESEKVNYGISSLSNAGNVGHQPTAATLPSQPLANALTGVSASPLLSEFASPDGNHGFGASVVYGTSAIVPTEEGPPSPVSRPRTLLGQNQDHQGVSCLASTIEDPMEHLLRMVKSMSPISLTSAISDISSAFSTFDSIAQSEPGDDGSIAEVGEDLAAHLQTPFVSQDEFTDTRKAKRLGNTICLDASERESTTTSTVKRSRIERRHPLLDEIREINQGLIDTVVDISQEDVDPAAALGVGKGTVVKCSFSTVALDPNLKSQYASESSPIQPLRLLVPATYPNCSPLLLDEFPDEVSKECDDLSTKVKRRFSSCMERFTQPVSLSEMARTWDVCARAVILEYAQQSGGGTFTSKYGAWKDSLTTA